MQDCIECGLGVIPMDSGACPSCGASQKPSVSRPEKTTWRRCYECQDDKEVGMDGFCPDCGAQLCDPGGCRQEVISSHNHGVAAETNRTDRITVDSDGLSAKVHDFKKRCDSFAVSNLKTDTHGLCEIDQLDHRLKQDILSEELSSSSVVTIYAKDGAGFWSQNKTTVRELAKERHAIGVLYSPIATFASKGFFIGVCGGVGLKSLETFVGIFSVEPILAILFLVAAALLFVPKIGLGPLMGLAVLAAINGMPNFFMMAFGAAFAGAVLGSMPGMAVGGIWGILNRHRIDRAPDAESEPSSVMFKVVVIPAIAATLIWIFYIDVAVPWALSYLS